MKGEGTMAEIINKGKQKVIALISILFIVVSVTVVWVAFNKEKREIYTEEEILDKCIDAINEGDGKWLTYCEACHNDETVEFLEYYYDVCDEYGWEDGERTEWQLIVKNGYEEEFGKLIELFGEEYKITYSIKNKEIVDRDSVNIERVSFNSASNVKNGFLYGGNYYDHLKNRLETNGVPEKEIKKCEALFEATYESNNRIKEIYKVEVEFAVSGTREVKFEDEIWFGKVGGRLVPLKYIEDSYENWFEHIVITPEYISNRVVYAVNEEEQIGLEYENDKEEVTEIFKNCIDAINTKDGKWYTYCSECNKNAIYFIEEYNQIIEGLDRDKPADSKYVEPIVDGYEEAFEYLQETFGEEYKITYNLKSIQDADVKVLTSFGDVYYKSVINADIEHENYMSNLEGILSEYKVNDHDKFVVSMNYRKAIEGTIALDEALVNRVFKLVLEFTVSGNKEVAFEKEIWVANIEGAVGEVVPFEFKNGDTPSLEHIIIDPEYIVDNVKFE